MPRCIYCLETKSLDEFNREHVVPESFGKFQDNLVIECVCRDCNDLFGREHDMKLARDSAEGLDRFQWGLKQPAEYKNLGSRSTTWVEIRQEGPLKGTICRFVPSADGTELNVQPIPQVGFCTTADGEFRYFRLDELPTQEELKRLTGAVSGSQLQIRTWAATWDEAWPLLEAKGFSSGELVCEVWPDHGRAQSEVVFRISHPEFRAMAKIAFNYLAHTMGPSFALMPTFNEIRRYVRADVHPDVPPVRLIAPRYVERASTARPALAHFVTLERHAQAIVAQVSLFCRLRYLVSLSRVGLVVQASIRSAHVFDLETKRVFPAEPPPIDG